MSGIDKIILDTNAIIAFANKNEVVVNYVSNCKTVYVSIISYLEFKIGKNKNEILVFNIDEFINNTDVINLIIDDVKFMDAIVNIRKETKLKLPDAIIAATALINNATIITNDKEFKKVTALKIKSF